MWIFKQGESTFKSISFTIAVASVSRCPDGFAHRCALSVLGWNGGEMVWRFKQCESTCKSILVTIAVAGDSRCPDGFALGCALSGLGRKGIMETKIVLGE